MINKKEIRNHSYCFTSHFYLFFFLLLGACLAAPCHAQSIEEKKAGLGGKGNDLDAENQAVLEEVNEKLAKHKSRLQHLQKEVKFLHEQGAPTDHFPPLLKEIREERLAIVKIMQKWRKRLHSIGKDETYALWHQPETTLEQLVSDYGSLDHVYIIPPEVGFIKVSIDSNLAIPREAWSELLELILTQNGVGIRQLNPFMRELYLVREGHEVIELITNKPSDLSLASSHMRVCYVLNPEFEDARRVYQVLEKFVRRSLTSLQLIGQNIYVVGRPEDIREVLKIYDFIRNNHSEQQYRLVHLKTGNAADMAEMLQAMFQEQPTQANTREGEGNGTHTVREDWGNLRVLSLKNAGQTLFLYGAPQRVTHAEKVIRELESQLGEAREKTVFWYTCQHSEAEEIAKVLDKVYSLMKVSKLEAPEGTAASTSASAENSINLTAIHDHEGDHRHDYDYGYNNEQTHNSSDVYDDGYSIVINPKRVDFTKQEDNRADTKRKNFIVDAKTGSIIMVVEPELLDRLKDLLRKIDVPKKMVQLDIIVFEKSFRDTTEYGLHLLNLGGTATGTNASAIDFNNRGSSGSLPLGILDFIYKQAENSSFPAVDLTYRFISTQEDITINANPSITTINKTPAVLSIVQESSLSKGTVTDKNTDTTSESFVRAQYGISLEVTPTIHETADDREDCGEFTNYITLQTNLNFDTIRSSINDRPVVDRRNIKNEVRIADGQTLILGGLRRKDQTDEIAAVPVLGELPGFGKLFSHNQLIDETREIFVFITPSVIADQWSDICRVKRYELCRRPGDSVEFVERLKCAQKSERERRVVGAMKMLFGRPEERSCKEQKCWGEYDGCG